MSEEKQLSNRPSDDPFTQQNLPTCPPKEFFSMISLSLLTLVIGIIFLPTGSTLLEEAQNVFEKKITYDRGYGTYCSIGSQNQGRICNVTFTFDETVDSPIYLYYELENYYQNHRRYISSRSITQLQGEVLSENDVSLDCTPLYMNDSMLLNPCGLIANSFFNDEFTVLNSSRNVILDEDNIALPEDKQHLYKQVNGFQYAMLNSIEATQVGCQTTQNFSPPTTQGQCATFGLDPSCLCYTDVSDGQQYLFYYPDNDTTQYLYESYPNQISPIEGVTDQHFIVWMRTATLPTFRKLYGTLSTSDGASFQSGDTITIEIVANFEVDSFDGAKLLLVSNLGGLGGKNVFTGQAYITVGTILLTFGLLVLGKELWGLQESWT